MTSHKHGQPLTFYILFSLKLPLSTFTFYVQMLEGFFLFPAAHGAVPGPRLAASDSNSSKRKNSPQQTSQGALEGKFPFWVCCLKEFPMQADVNS